MRFWVGITDKDWFDFLAARSPDEVNFWQPSPTAPARLEPGVPFLFKLHAPQRTVVEGVYRDGKLASLRVTPGARRRDVTIVGK